MSEFGLDPEKAIVGTTGDGASVMVLFGKNIPSEYLQCNDHAIHLGVTTVLYKKKSNVEEAQEEEFFVECENDSDEEENHEEKNDEDVNDIEEIEELDDSIPIIERYDETIKRMRKIITHFRRSPVKNEVLQRFVRAEKQKELQLIIDSKTRWGSLYDACSRFFDLLKPIETTLLHLEMNDNFPWTENDTTKLEVRSYYYFNLLFLMFFFKIILGTG